MVNPFRFKNEYVVWILPLLVLTLSFFGCKSGPETSEMDDSLHSSIPGTDPPGDMKMTSLVFEDQALLIAALYHLPETKDLFEDRNRWIGQSPDMFLELMEDEEKEKLLSDFHLLMEELPPAERIEKNNLIHRWGHMYKIISHLTGQFTLERFTAAVWETGSFEHLFGNSLEMRNLNRDQVTADQLSETLSSAETIELYHNIVTELTLADSYEALALLEQIMEKLFKLYPD